MVLWVKSPWVASSDCASNPMPILIRLTAPAVMLRLVCLWVDIFHVAFPNGPGGDEGSAPPGSYERDCWEA